MPPNDELLPSSPDPLALSDENTTTPSPTKARGASITPRKPLLATSGNTTVQDFYLATPPAKCRSSPAKRSGQNEDAVSPWRIRLTLQAEQVNGKEITQARILSPDRLTGRTTTTTIPLKGGDDSPPIVAKRGRGRPRKSLDSPTKRNGTPKPKATGRRKTMLEAAERQDDTKTTGAATPTKKKTRKSMQPKLETGQPREDITPVSTPRKAKSDQPTAGTKSTRPRSKGRRQEITPMRIAYHSDASSQKSPKEPSNVGFMSVQGSMEIQQPANPSVPATTDHTTKQDAEECGTGSFSQSFERSHLDVEDEAMWRSMIRRDSQSPARISKNDQEQPASDPTEEHQEFDSILESEGFSMVSVSSLPSAGHHSDGSADRSEFHYSNGDVSRLLSPSAPPEPKTTPLDISRFSMQKNSTAAEYPSLKDACLSPETKSPICERTPSIATSPSVAPAIETAEPHSSPRPLDTSTNGTPKLTRVVRAATTLQRLQDVISPQEHDQELGTLGSPFHKSVKPSPFLTVEKPTVVQDKNLRQETKKPPSEHHEKIFTGFGAGTRRELRAGLRLGEELAKRQRNTSIEHTIGTRAEDDVFQVTTEPEHNQLPKTYGQDPGNLKKPEFEQTVSYPLLMNKQLPSPEGSETDANEDQMSWTADTPIKMEEPVLPTLPDLARTQLLVPDDSGIDHTMLAREAEWQLEREAVSRQIQMANTSQVIVINSDDKDFRLSAEYDKGSEELHESASPLNVSRESIPHVSDLFQQSDVAKPRRSMLPSPWRRNSQVTKGPETAPTESDLFWQPDQAQSKAAEKRQERKRRLGRMPEGSSISNVDESGSAGGNSLSEVLTDEISHSKPSLTKSPESETWLLPNKQNERFAEPSEPSLASDTWDQIQQMEQSSGCNSAIALTDAASSLLNHSSSPNRTTIDPQLLSIPVDTIPSPAQTQASSWLSLLTAPISRLFTPNATLPPATKSDILCSSANEPLSQLIPWKPSHSRALTPLYYASHLYGSYIFPYNSRSPSAQYLGQSIRTSLGWERRATKMDCGVTDAFMILLEARAISSSAGDGKKITEGLVLKKCVQIWVGMVMRGEVEMDRAKGEVVGLRSEGDRAWTRGDIRWDENQGKYFARKKKDWGGLPSWREKGLV